MDSGGECSEVVTTVIRFTTPKTVTVNHDRLPVFILFYFILPVFSFTALTYWGSNWFACGPLLSHLEFSMSVLRIWILIQRKSIKTDEHMCSARDLSTSMAGQSIIPSKAPDRSFELFIGRWCTRGRIETYIWKYIFSVSVCLLVFLFYRKQTKLKKLKLRKPLFL